MQEHELLRHRPIPRAYEQGAANRRARDAEAELVRELKARSQAAWALLYEDFYEPIFRYGYARTTSIDRAEDIVASTFQRALAGIDAYAYQGRPLLAWLYGIARNVTREERRRTGGRTARFFSDVFSRVANQGSPEVADESADPHRGDIRIDLASALDVLTADQRDVIIMRYLQGLSAREAGAVLGKHEAAVHALQARALAALRRHMTH